MQPSAHGCSLLGLGYALHGSKGGPPQHGGSPAKPGGFRLLPERFLHPGPPGGPPPPACVSHRHGASCAGSRLPRHRDPCLGRFPCLRLGQPSFWGCTAVQSQPLDSGAGCGQRLVLAHQNFPDRSSLGIIGRRFLGPSARGLGASLAPRTPRLRGAGASGHGPGLLGP